jgi:two-component system, NarL family, invasion response regulator UvrY
MKILLADDHAILRKGLIQLLAEEYPKAEFGEASTTSEALANLSREPWDVVVLDIFLPGRNGLEVLHEVRKQDSNLPVLVLSSAPEEQLAIRVLKAGASGYLNKQSAPEDLVKAVRKVLTGGRYVSAALAEHLAEEIVRTDRSPQDNLSDREYAVMLQLVAGRSIKEIAFELSLSPKTVSTYHARIKEKLHVINDAKLVRYAIEHGIEEEG